MTSDHIFSLYCSYIGGRPKHFGGRSRPGEVASCRDVRTQPAMHLTAQDRKRAPFYRDHSEPIGGGGVSGFGCRGFKCGRLAVCLNLLQSTVSFLSR